MPQTYYVDPRPDYGSDAYTGKDKKHPFLTLDKVMTLDLKPGDEIRIRRGTTIDIPTDPLKGKPFTLKANGVTLSSYMTGTEAASMASIAASRLDTRPMITLEGYDNIVTGIDTWNGLRHIAIKPGYRGNRIVDVRCHHFALGMIDYANGTTIQNCSFFDGRMLRNEGKDTDVGASAITLWREVGHTHSDTRIFGCYAEDCYAPSLAFKDGDGSFVELFGGIENVEIVGCLVRDSKIFMEMGGTTARKEVTHDILISQCLVIDTMGQVLYVNPKGIDPKTGQPYKFSVDFENVRFAFNTFKVDDADKSPFFIGAGHGDLSKKLTSENNIIVASSQIYNAGPDTRVSSLTHSNNLYWRSDGSTNVGVPFINGDRFDMPRFHAQERGDYRLMQGHPLGDDVGALGAAREIETIPTVIKAGDYILPDGVRTMRGGHESVPLWRNLLEIPGWAREAGMTRYVHQHRRIYMLAEDKVSWLKM